jgi:hypothetical protein
VVSDFFSTRIFGPDRRTHLAAALTASAADGAKERATELAAVQRAIAALERRQTRLIQGSAEGSGTESDTEAERCFREAIRSEHAAIERQRQDLRSQLADPDPPPTAQRGPGDPALLEALPQLDLRLDSAPETIQRAIYDAFELRLRYSRPREEIAISVMITRDTHDRLRDLDAGSSASCESGTEHRSPERAHVMCTPDGIRTRATALKGRRPGPLDDGGWRAA